MVLQTRAGGIATSTVLAALTVGTDCSGMDSPLMALRNLNVAVDHRFSSDICRHAEATLLANWQPAMFYRDVVARDCRSVDAVSFYAAGFPCQPFSQAGLQQGFADEQGRGGILFHLLAYIRVHAPRAFLLENVKGLMLMSGGACFRAVLEALQGLDAYIVHWCLLDTQDHGVPHRRPRLYFAGIRKDCATGTFSWPKPIARPSIERFLEPRRRRPADTDLPPLRQGTARVNVLAALAAIRARGRDPLREPWLVDCDSSAGRMSFAFDVSPCLTSSRGNGHWITNRGRRMTKAEMMRLQGMPTPGPASLAWCPRLSWAGR